MGVSGNSESQGNYKKIGVIVTNSIEFLMKKLLNILHCTVNGM
jgi:uncharacterized protein (DUF362 family)